MEMARFLRSVVAAQAERLAETEEAVGRIFDQMADEGGPRSEQRRTTAQQARRAAQNERELARRYRSDPG
jgi:polyhydroxyalkanoate synthesis regulator phasin